MTTVLVLGGSGMLGGMVFRVLSAAPRLAVRATQRRDPDRPFWLDVEGDPDAVARALDEGRPPDYAINCIGITKERIRPGDPVTLRQAIVVNAVFPHDLARAALERGTRVVHVSTDGVFAGGAEVYLEDAPHDGADAYAKTKSLGEIDAPHALTLRCSIIGPDPLGRRGLLEWLRGQPRGAAIHGYTNHVWNGVTTLQFARLCEHLVGGDFAAVRGESPVHHVCSNCAVTKHDLLEMLARVYRPDVRVVPMEAPIAVRRVLATRFNTLRRLSETDQPMEVAVRELAEFEGVSTSIKEH